MADSTSNASDAAAAESQFPDRPLRRPWLPAAVVAWVAVSIFALRLAAPPNLLDQDQERPAAYVLDAVKNGNWLCQRDLFGAIMSKPPVWSWLSAAATLACGRINVFSLYLPGALAAAGTAGLIFLVGRRYFGDRAAFIGAIASMVSNAGVKAFGLARTDSVFAFTVCASALLAWRAWNLGRGWTWFWLLGAVATLTKGPLGVLLGAIGLVAAWWERRSGREPMPLRGTQLPGVALFLLIAGGWLWLAWLQYGDAVTAKLIGKELVAQSVGAQRDWPGKFFYQPLLFYLARGAPWSVVAIYGLWRVWKSPSAGPTERRFERFLFCWLVGGLGLFSIATHQRGDLLWPIMPAGALLAGRECARWSKRLRPPAFCWGFGALLALGLGGFAAYYFGPRAWDPLIARTIALKTMADALEHRGGREFPLTHVDDPMALQIYLNTLRPQISFARAAQLLRGPEAAFLAVNDFKKLEAARTPDDPPVYSLLPEPGGPTASPTKIVGNRPELKPADAFAFCFGSIYLRAHGVRLVEATEREFCFAPAGSPAEVYVTNESAEARRIVIRIGGKGRHGKQEQLLVPKAVWHYLLPAQAER